MCRHMEAVRQQRHGAGRVAGDDLADHHQGGEQHHPSRAAGVLVVRGPEEYMLVRVSFDFR